MICPICESEKLEGKRCSACLDLTDEEWALNQAIIPYIEGKIEIDELEKRIEKALKDPPKRLRDPTHIVFM